MLHLPLTAAVAWALAGQPATLHTEHAAPAAVGAPDAAETAAPALDDLRFLAGAWEHTEDGMHMREVWDQPLGDAMVGHFVIVSEGSAVLYELFSVEQGEEGAPVLRLRHFHRGLTPWASEAEGPLTLTLTETEENRAVFANPENDFPQQLIYELKDDTLTATLVPAAGSTREELRLEFTAAPRPDEQ